MFKWLQEKMGFIKRIEAPAWFVKARKDSDAMYREAITILPIPKDVKTLILESKDINDQKIMDAVKNMTARGVSVTRDQLLKADITREYAHAMTHLLWSKFRYENMDNEFGRSPNLHYDATQKVIEIK